MAKAWKLEGEALLPSTSVADAAPRLLGRKLAELRHHASLTTERKDPEDLHALRVATRRLRAALALLGGPLADLNEGVRRLGQALGRLRDRDVLLLWLDERLARARETGRDDEVPGIARLDGEQRAGLPPLEALMRAALVAFEAHVGQPLALRIDEAGFAEPLGGRRVRRRLASRLGKVAAQATRLGGERRGLADVPAVHELRIAAKKLRYELELVEDVLDGAADAVEALKPLQQAIGDLHDADVRQALLVPYVVAVERFEQPGAVKLLRKTLEAREQAAEEVARILAAWQEAPVLEPLARRLEGP